MAMSFLMEIFTHEFTYVEWAIFILYALMLAYQLGFLSQPVWQQWIVADETIDSSNFSFLWVVSYGIYIASIFVLSKPISLATQNINTIYPGFAESMLIWHLLIAVVYGFTLCIATLQFRSLSGARCDPIMRYKDTMTNLYLFVMLWQMGYTFVSLLYLLF